MNKKNIWAILLSTVLIVIVYFFIKDSFHICFKWILNPDESFWQKPENVSIDYKKLERFYHQSSTSATKTSVAVKNVKRRKGKIYKNPENMLLGFRFDRGDMLKDKDLVAKYGEGCVVYEEGVIRRQYKVNRSSTIVIFGLGDTDNKAVVYIEIKEGNIADSCKPKIPFTLLRTGKGLKLGDDISKVKKLYPNPAYILEKGEEHYSFLNQIPINKLCYRLDYTNVIMFSKDEDPRGFSPYVNMYIEICNSKVKSIRLDGVGQLIFK